jgi:hypothetical protein
LALAESALILLYHIFFSHLIFLFIIRLAKMLEQVTICFILIELTLKRVNFMIPFRLSLYLFLACLVIVIAILLEEGSYDLLKE